MVLSFALHRGHEPIKKPLMIAVDKMVCVCVPDCTMH